MFVSEGNWRKIRKSSSDTDIRGVTAMETITRDEAFAL